MNQTIDFLKIGKAKELSGRDYKIYRLLEILPGGLSLLTIFGLIICSYFKPVWVAYFVIAFDVYWLLLVVYMAIFLITSYVRLKRGLRTDWKKKCQELSATCLDKDVASDSLTRKGLVYSDLIQLIILPTYNEGVEIIKTALDSIINDGFSTDQMIIALAMEERGGEDAKARAVIIKEEYQNKFKHFVLTWHPDGIEGEIKGKGANQAWCVRELKKNLVDVNDEKISKNNEYKQQLYNSYLVQLNEEIAKNKSTIENTKDNTIIQVTLPENVDSNLLKINYSSNSCIVAVTEGPTQNILDWATKTYQIEDGPIRRQVMTGVHSEEVWKSVIFQLLIALYVMAKHNIAFNNFKLGDNVFIKDLSTDLNNIGYWKYKLEGIDFYVPNYGFVVLIDSNFKDIENDSSKDNKYKIYGKLYNDTESIINNVTNKNYNNLSDTEFDQQFTLGGGIKPPPKIIEIMNKINKDNANEPIKHLKNIIIENFTEYLHSRVGTPIKSDELNLLQEHNKNFNIGDVIALMINPEYHIISIIININDNKISLATSDHNTSDIKKIICKHNYTKDELIRIEGSIEQVYSPNKKLADLDLLETYNIS